LACCRALHRRYGTTYYFAAQCFPRELRLRTHAVYAFVRTPDEWVDNPAEGSNPLELLGQYRKELLRGVEGVRPDSPVLRAFCDLIRETGLPLDEALLFLDAMELDLTVRRYPTYNDLRGYMRGSAGAVGVMMCSALGAELAPGVIACAKALGEAMQLTNFLRDVTEDAKRGRIYLPLEDLSSFGLEAQDVLNQRMSDGFVQLMKFEIKRARSLYQIAEPGISLLPRQTQSAVRVASALYARILDRIETAGCDVFNRLVRTSRAEKLFVAASVLVRK
jgi:phytoene synthase